MARRTMHHKKKFTIPLAIVAGFIPAVMDVKNVHDGQGVSYPVSIMHTAAGLIGYDTFGKSYRGWSQASAAGLPSIILGFLAHWAAQKFGINRMIARAGIPLIRI